jgi:ketosteroid isomerase-like protein
VAEKELAVVMRGLDAFNRGDIEGLVAEVDPQVVWEEGGLVFPDLPPAYNGPEGVRQWWQEAIVEAWESFSAELLDLRDEGGGKIVQVYRLRGRGRKSGIDVDMRVVQTITVRDGRIAHRRIERLSGTDEPRPNASAGR